MDNSVVSKYASREYWTVDDIRVQIERSKIVLFGRGSNDNPRCGYTREAIDAIASSGQDYEHVDVANDPSAAAALRAFAGPVSLPAMYLDGELLGSPEQLYSMIESGELGRLLS